MMKMYRQGDVLIMEVADIPSSAKEESFNKRIVLAYGEVTGHAHAFYEKTCSLLRDGEDVYLSCGSASSLKHEEHSTIIIPPGTYKVIRQREYTPQAIRQVAD